MKPFMSAAPRPWKRPSRSTSVKDLALHVLVGHGHHVAVPRRAPCRPPCRGRCCASRFAFLLFLATAPRCTFTPVSREVVGDPVDQVEFERCEVVSNATRFWRISMVVMRHARPHCWRCCCRCSRFCRSCCRPAAPARVAWPRLRRHARAPGEFEDPVQGGADGFHLQPLCGAEAFVFDATRIRPPALMKSGAQDFLVAQLLAMFVAGQLAVGAAGDHPELHLRQGSIVHDGAHRARRNTSA